MGMSTNNPRLTEDRESGEVVDQKGQMELLPLVTVVISLYNYRDYIIPCLESVKSQTISNINLVLVDDCSMDDSLSVVRNWHNQNSDRFNQYTLIRHKSNSGLAKTRNTGFLHSRTKYVFILDADNLLYPRCLESLVDALENCDASFAYCYLEKFGGVNGLQNIKPWNPSTLGVVNPIDAMVLIRKSIWETVGGYSTNETMRLGWEDYELWFKIARIKGWGVQVPEILAKYRVHKTSMLNTVTNPNVDKLWIYLKKTYPEFFR
jgi:glycosyltransferase involved in cell wall biosynthesis